MMRQTLLIAALVSAFTAVPIAYATPPPVIRESVGVCDYNAPTHCAAPNSDGSVNVKVTGGTGGTVAISQTTPGVTNGVQVNAPIPAGTNVIGHVITDTGSTTQTVNTGYASTNASTTVTLGGTYQTVFALNTSRHGCTIENPVTATEALSIRQGGTAVWTINAGGVFQCTFPGGIVTDLIEVTGATTGHAFTAVSQ